MPSWAKATAPGNSESVLCKQCMPMPLPGFILPVWSSYFLTHSVDSPPGTVQVTATRTQEVIYLTFDLFWTIAKPSHRDYFELHRMQINIYRTIVELRTLTIDTKSFTTLWIVQNHTNTALVIEILASSPLKDSGCVCCPLVGVIRTDTMACQQKTSAKFERVSQDASPRRGWRGVVEMWICIEQLVF